MKNATVKTQRTELEYVKVKIFISLIILFGGLASAEPSFSIKQSCSSQEVNLFSLTDRKGGNIAEAGHFKYQMCGEGVSTAQIRDSCKTGESSVISMFQRNDSHASTFSEYRWNVCVDGFETSVNQSCDTPIFSLHSKSDSHVAEPGHFKYQVCQETEKVDNISLELSTDAGDVYVDGEQSSGGIFNTLELSNPYIATEEGLGLVSYGELKQIRYVSGEPDSLEMVQTSGSFLVPNTKSYSEIEDEVNRINSRSFLELEEASFGFSIPKNPLINVGYEPAYSVKGFSDRLSGDIGLYVRKLYSNSSKIRIGTR